MDIKELKELEELREKIEKETIQKIVKLIEINDSYLYAKMVIYEPLGETNIFRNKLSVKIEINLYNSQDFSQDFSQDCIVNQNKEVKKAKIIKSTLEIDKDLVNQKEDLMMLVYDEVSKEIAKDLFQSNTNNINQTIKINKKYL